MTAEPRRAAPALVELVRLVVVVLCTGSGYEISRRVASDDLDSSTLILGTLVACGVGYVAGGVLGRTVGTLIGVAEHRIAEVSGADLVAGGAGMLVGLIGGTAVAWPLLLLPLGLVTVPTLMFVLVVVGFLGSRVAIRKREDLLQLFGLSHRTRAGDLRVLDTSAILDVRLLDLVRLGFLRGTLLVPEFVLEEVQAIADSPEAAKRGRGRRGLESLTAMKREALADIRVVERSFPEFEKVDAKVIALARERGAAIVSNDTALGRIAELQGIEVLSPTLLANKLRPPVLPGETVAVDLIKAGREPGQGIGYLEDGSMVVVEEAVRRIGSTVTVHVTSVVQTSGGRMLFARLGAPEGHGIPRESERALDAEEPQAASAPQDPLHEAARRAAGEDRGPA